jgi:hypothetical protein
MQRLVPTTLKSLATGLFMLGALLSTGCASHKCSLDDQEPIAGAASYCDWTLVEQSGDMPSWRTGAMNGGTRFVGEGVHKFKERAREAALLSMSKQVAASTGYDVESVAVYRSTTSGGRERENFRETTTGSVSATVSIPPTGTWWDLRWRHGYQEGLKFKERVYRYIIMAEIDG